ncbi:MAG: hypothetical protein JW892_10020 [Anaerolineae bacterium]|nr:hypothetical protein [Anaerolineae bacterium]
MKGGNFRLCSLAAPEVVAPDMRTLAWSRELLFVALIVFVSVSSNMALGYLAGMAIYDLARLRWSPALKV